MLEHNNNSLPFQEIPKRPWDKEIYKRVSNGQFEFLIAQPINWNPEEVEKYQSSAISLFVEYYQDRQSFVKKFQQIQDETWQTYIVHGLEQNLTCDLSDWLKQHPELNQEYEALHSQNLEEIESNHSQGYYYLDESLKLDAAHEFSKRLKVFRLQELEDIGFTVTINQLPARYQNWIIFRPHGYLYGDTYPIFRTEDGKYIGRGLNWHHNQHSVESATVATEEDNGNTLVYQNIWLRPSPQFHIERRFTQTYIKKNPGEFEILQIPTQ